jgi:Uma2 family endonuclease
MGDAAQRVELVFEVPRTHPAWVLEDDEVMPEPAAQDEASQTMVSVLRQWRQSTGRVVRVRRNLAVRWDEANPKVGVDPDVCLLDPPPEATDAELTSLCLWKPGTSAPRVAFEVVSATTAAKDYREGPRKYAVSGTRELWVFDPLRQGPDDDGGPWRLQVWARGRAGQFRRVFAGDGPAYSEEMAAWLVVSEDGMYLRLSDDEEGTRLWSTEAEVAAQARQAMEAERAAKDEALAAKDEALAAKEAERAAKEAERAAKEAALARIAELERLLKGRG